MRLSPTQTFFWIITPPHRGEGMRDKALKTSLWGVNFDVEGEQCILMFSQTFTAFLVEIIFSC